MKSNIKNVSKKTPKAFAVGTHEGLIFASVPYTLEDLKNAVLIVSLLINAALLILWIMTQVSSIYAGQVAQALVQ